MERGLYIAASGMLAAEIRQDVIANRLANATNPGFKGEVMTVQSFGDMLLSSTQTGAALGPLSLGAQVTGIRPNLTNQGFRWTQNALDLAIGGNGWFQVQTATGVVYTRNGAFTTDPTGNLMTAQGDLVLGVDGKPLNLAGGGKVAIGRDGAITVGGAAAGKIAVIALDPATVDKLGENYVSGTVVPNGSVGDVAQGALESSNVNTVNEMVMLIENMRNFEADQKAIRAIDDTLDKAVNQVGRV